MTTAKQILPGTCQPLAMLLTMAALSASVAAEPRRVYEEGKQPNDIRLQPLKDLNGYFPFQPATNVMQWRARRGRAVRAASR